MLGKDKKRNVKNDFALIDFSDKKTRMKKTTFIILLQLLLLAYGYSQSSYTYQGVAGIYKYESITDVPVIVMETEYDDSTDTEVEVPVKSEDEYKDRLILTLNVDSTFELKSKSTGGGVNSSEISYGYYVVHNDSLYLFSPLPVKTNKLWKVNKPISKTWFKITFKGGFDGKKSQILDFVRNCEFYSLNRTFEKTKLSWNYTIPDTLKLADSNQLTIDTVSFVFKRVNIGAYFLSFKNEKDSVMDNSLLLKMADYKQNNYFVGYEKAPEDYYGSHYEYFFDVSTFVFLIRPDELISINKNINEVGKPVNFRFKKMP